MATSPQHDVHVTSEMIERPLRAATAQEWRAWLERNHADRDEVWLQISKKRATTQTVSLGEATEEALCFGWIDSVLHPIDEGSYALRYTPRRKGSRWSRRMKEWAMQLIEQGRMTPAGLAKIQEAESNGRWDESYHRGGIYGKRHRD
jgi:uncharacterized protein YdeI (YjbR/CyaY-like superfamily)